ncbi:hypothetical protein B0T44_23195 [Nocardia donostiensis]|uniref:Polyketide synthase n=1 Tax=Nocardia donostiensis TaxID=1538463 RepID=A0A1V2T946_9NOCA|nr:hypothetical protein B0T46_25135 [Nocardia donostiensis]OQS17735.1 hypothetical protein B0T44_23195 [Nocardia donostiensis]
MAEGVGVLVVEPLSRARELGHEVLAVVRGTAVNQDGASNGLTAPNGPSQQRVIGRALASAGVGAGDVDVVEAHGTGTVLGDPIEAQALIATYGQDRSAENPLWLGSIKSNIGHTQAAAGVAGVIKMVQAMRHEVLPRTLHVDAPTPHVDWSAGTVRLLTEQQPWPRTAERPRRAGVSSFGISGTNAHVILEEAPAPDQPAQPPVPDTPAGATAWVISARTRTSLFAQLTRLTDFVAGHPDLTANEVGRALARRARFEHRAVVIGTDRDQLLTRSTAYRDSAGLGEEIALPGVVEGTARGTGRIAFVFSGQGAQWIGMGRELLDSAPIFDQAIEECAEVLTPLVDWSLRDVLRAADDTHPDPAGSAAAALLQRVDVVQPALFAVMIGLARWWRSLGVEPDAVAGHSQGEIAAAHVAGALTLADAARIVVDRSRVIADELAGTGAMASVTLPPKQVTARLGAFGDELSIAAVNGPASVVVSGTTTAVQTFLSECAAADVRATRVPVDYASHSAQVDRLRDPLLTALRGITPRRTEIAFYSTVTGTAVDTETLDADYWYRNLRSPVRFADTIRALHETGHTVFVETSPHPVLTPGIEALLEPADTPAPARTLEPPAVVVGSLRRGDGGLGRLLESAARLDTAGVEVGWSTLYDAHTRRVRLPTYPFQHEHYWLTPAPGSSGSTAPAPTAAAPFSVQSFGDVAEPGEPTLARRLAGQDEAEQLTTVLTAVRRQLAVVLGHPTPTAVDPDRTFQDLGFDSVSAVEARNRLHTITGLTLPSTLVFDHPTPRAVAVEIHRLLTGSKHAEDAPAIPVSTAEPIAIVGIGCRFPGGAAPDALWRMLLDGRDAIGPFPTDRGWDLDTATDASFVRAGGFLDDAADFDAGFFGISPREALAMDPQQRLLLETVWEALEHAGIDPLTLRGSDTGVFVGVTSQAYGAATSTDTDIAGYRLTGMLPSVVSGRVAYVLGLEGPAVSVDTACSSSLVALHQAVRSLRTGECRAALVGGVAVTATPAAFAEFSRQGGLAPDGRCKAFADSADGTGFAEGVGVLVVEPLTRARELDHEVLAVVRGSAVNQDGASNGLSAPNGPSQQRVIRRALADAGLEPDTIDAVEAHGTGTVLGDPIEAGALLATYGQDRAADRPLWLGSIKSNIGHAQAAAGVAGVIKMVLALRHETLPRTLHVDQPTRQVDWGGGAVRLLTEQRPWSANGRPRRAGVSSFGISGTNAHVILEEAPATATGLTEPASPPISVLSSPLGGELSNPSIGGSIDQTASEAADQPAGESVKVPLAWIVSARSRDALAAQAGRLEEFVRDRPETDPADIGWSLLTGRARFDHRAVVLGRTRTELLSGLHGLATGTPTAGVLAGAVAARSKTVFVFPGQGGEWAGMGRELLAASPVFAATIAECEAGLAPWVDWSLREVLAAPPEQAGPLLARIEVVQPVLCAVMVGVARVWETLGVRPDAVVGHSQGEIAAACVAGVLTPAEAMRLVAIRSRLFADELADSGAIAAVALPAAEIEQYLTRFPALSLAAVNGPAAVSVSGPADELARLVTALTSAGVRARVVVTTVASHAPVVDRVREQLIQRLSSIAPRNGDIPVYSTVTGGVLAGTEMTATYWFRNCRNPVLFEPAVRALRADGFDVFVETGPHPVLTPHIDNTLAETGTADGLAPLVADSLHRDQGTLDRLLESAARLYVAGAPVDWSSLYTGTDARRVPLPTYAFQRRRYWLDTVPMSTDISAAGLSPTGHPLLTSLVADPETGRLILTGQLSLHRHPWLADHAFAGAALFPGTGFLDLALCAGARAGTPAVRELTLLTPLLVSAGTGPRIQVIVAAADETGARSVSIYSQSGDEQALHAEGRLIPDHASEHGTVTVASHTAARRRDTATAGLAMPTAELEMEVPIPNSATAGLATSMVEPGTEFGVAVEQADAQQAWPPVGAVPVPVVDLYDRMAEAGYGYGPRFQGLRAVWRRGEDLFAEVVLPDCAAGADGYRVHPAALDAVLHAMAAAVADTGFAADPVLPFAWEEVRVYRAEATTLRAWITTTGRDSAVALHIRDQAGCPVASIGSLTLRPVRGDAVRQTSVQTIPLHTLTWRTAPSRRLSGRVAYTNWQSAVVDTECHADVVVLDCRARGTEPVADTHSLTAEVLSALQRFGTDPRFASATLLILTRGAVSVSGEAVTDLAGAATWGLVRSAQSEDPGRIVAVDLDSAPGGVGGSGAFGAPGTPGDLGVIEEIAAAAVAGREPHLAVRGGVLHVARVTRVPHISVSASEVPGLSSGTVLVTGGTGRLGAEVARHLVRCHGARSLLLVSRRGGAAAGTDRLVDELTSHGASVRVAACDVGDRVALEELLATIPEDRPLKGVIHAAMLLDDGVVSALTPARLEAVLAAKADAAWYLHELTRGRDLAFFVMFSSAAGVFGAPGQGNYAAANAFLDGLATYRRARGLPATSIAWGWWESTSEMTAHLAGADAARMSRAGVVPLTVDQGMALFDAAMRQDLAAVLAVRLHRSKLAALAEMVPALRELAPAATQPATVADNPDQLRAELTGLDEAGQERMLQQLIVRHAAAVLGHTDAADVGSDFTSAGFDSLTAMELRNALTAATGVQLSPLAIFEHPGPAPLARYLRGRLTTKTETGDTEIAELFRHALTAGQVMQGCELLRAAARLRPVFERTGERSGTPAGVRLTDGEHGPHLVFICAPLFTGRADHYARIVAELGPEHRISAVPLSGFGTGEPLPSDADAALTLLTETVLELVGDEPFVLIGHSSGGTLAAAVAKRLPGSRLDSLILLDSFLIDTADPVFDALVAKVFDMAATVGDFTSTSLTGMLTWLDLVPQVQGGAAETDTLFVQCSTPVFQTTAPGANEPTPVLAQPWSSAQTLDVVATDHFSLCGDDAGKAAEAIERWLRRKETQ